MTTLTTPKDLIAAVPFLIGFNPTDSIVLLSLNSDAIAMAIRIDFPDQIGADELRLLTSHLSRDGADSVIAIFYSSEIGQSQNEIMSEVLAAITDFGLSLREVITVEKDRYRSLICEDLSCCPSQGSQLPELIDSRIAAEQVAQGRPIPYATLEQLIDSISPLDSDEELLRQVFNSGWAPNSFAQMRSELHPKICSELFSGTI
jgi:hypothetical protein